MSPEPTHQPMNQDFITENSSINRIAENHESDSDDDEIETAGYLPLSQVPTDSDLIIDHPDNDNEDDETISSIIDSTPQIALPIPELQSQPTPETLHLWSSSANNNSNIDLDPVKINQVKSMMANFVLPETAIPEWASTVTEDMWKSQLVNRIKEIREEL
ncbi:male-enhanced antigen 1 [Cotesia typhae]|uniref:male-enhanced antigen 1 n=1 Tax=Cotesia typhae TaxID=2053667 RepID=UPI003D694831